MTVNSALHVVVNTYKWFKFPLVNETKLTDEVVEMFVTKVNVRFLYTHNNQLIC